MLWDFWVEITYAPTPDIILAMNLSHLPLSWRLQHQLANLGSVGKFCVV